MAVEDEHACAMGCCTCWGIWGSFTGGILLLVFGILALLPSGPFGDRNTVLGVVLVVLGATGVGSLVGYAVCALPGFCIGFFVDKAMESEVLFFFVTALTKSQNRV
ncbi:hypothetical protein R1sor_013931 [Riccia sorocarpa]|uniref:Transmembrane protein n=1 Tax=Riccia sorocarpa TaxID=122646 RepID=A0ABD3HAK4_9MARC